MSFEPVSGLVPQYVKDLNSWAEGHGLVAIVETFIYEGEQVEQIEHLGARWIGTKEQIRSLGMLRPSYHFPQSVGTLMLPTRQIRPSQALAAGAIAVTGDGIVFEIDFGTVPLAIDQQYGVEIVSCRDETAYYGAAADLAPHFCEPRRLPLGKKEMVHRKGWDVPDWSARRFPSGLILYRLQSVAAFADNERDQDTPRVATIEHGRPAPGSASRPRPSHLRLAWSNPQRAD